MKAVIMAGGEGSRLRPLTANTPKPMLPLANLPMMEHIVKLCRRHGLTEIVVTVQYLANVISNYFGDGEDLGVRLRYAVEEIPMGTAGSVRNAREWLDETFVVISGDALTDIDLGAAVDAHTDAGAIASIVLHEAENPLEFGIVITSEDGSVERFLEKPTWGQVFSDTVNTGIYVLEPRVLDLIVDGGPSDFSQDVFPGLLANEHRIHGHVANGYWEDVGNIEAYRKAHRDVLDGRVDLDVPGFRVSEGVWQGEDVHIGADAVIDGPALIGRNCRIERGARIGEYTVLGDNVSVGADATVQRTIVHENASISPRAVLRGTVVGKGADIRGGARADTDVVLGEGVQIGDHAVLNQSVKVFPFKSVEAGAVVNTSIVWESRAPRTLFGRRGVRGLANVDITPQLAVRLAMAYGSTLPKGAIVTSSRDASRAARALKRAFMAGLNATDVHLEDLEIATVPLTRFHTTTNAGGVTFRMAQSDPRFVEIRFFTPEGTDLGEGAQRRIERNFAREDFRRAHHDEMGDIYYPPRAQEFYTRALLDAIDVDAVRERRMKVVVDYDHGTASLVFPSVLARLGIDVLALNPYPAEVPPATDAAQLEEVVRASGSDFGFRIDRGAESATVVDDLGRSLDWTTTTLLFVRLVAESKPGSTIVLPVSATSHAERLAAAAGCHVARAQTSAASLLEATRAHGAEASLAVAEEGVVLPRFMCSFDAAAEFALLLELLAGHRERLSDLVDELPDVHMAREAVPTPWERKGAVMRSLVEAAGSDRAELVDGVKIVLDEGWVLVLPDQDEPVCHVWAEADSEPAARGIAGEYRGRIRRITG